MPSTTAFDYCTYNFVTLLLTIFVTKSYYQGQDFYPLWASRVFMSSNLPVRHVKLSHSYGKAVAINIIKKKYVIIQDTLSILKTIA